MMKDQNNKQRTDAERGQRSRSARPEPSVNMDELRELIALLRDNGLSEFELEREGFRVRLRRGVDFAGGETATGSAPSGSTHVPAGPVSTAGSAGAVAGSTAAATTIKGS